MKGARQAACCYISTASVFRSLTDCVWCRGAGPSRAPQGQDELEAASDEDGDSDGEDESEDDEDEDEDDADSDEPGVHEHGMTCPVQHAELL